MLSNELELQALTLTAGDRGEQVRPRVPPDFLFREGQSPQILTMELKTQRLNHRLNRLHKKPQSFLPAEPAVWKIRNQ